MKLFAHFIRAWQIQHYSAKLEEIKQNRVYLIAQTSATHKMLNDAEAHYSEKLLKLEPEKTS